MPQSRKDSKSKYAVVRYKVEREQARAIYLGHGRKVNGRRLRVFKWKKPRSQGAVKDTKN